MFIVRASVLFHITGLRRRLHHQLVAGVVVTVALGTHIPRLIEGVARALLPWCAATPPDLTLEHPLTLDDKNSSSLVNVSVCFLRFYTSC